MRKLNPREARLCVVISKCCIEFGINSIFFFFGSRVKPTVISHPPELRTFEEGTREPNRILEVDLAPFQLWKKIWG